MTALCVWAPLSHRTEATHLVTLEPSCGCYRKDIASCRDHARWALETRISPAATPCGACGTRQHMVVIDSRLVGQ